VKLYLQFQYYLRVIGGGLAGSLYHKVFAATGAEAGIAVL
jgi:hypothetical protein